VVFCLLLAAGRAGAQGTFAWRAPLDSIPRDGFYRIGLMPELVAKCSGTGLADVRILGPGNRFVAYVWKDTGTTAHGEKEWLPLPAPGVAQKDSSDKHSYVEVRFPEAYEIDKLSFVIRDPVFFKRHAGVFAQGAHGSGWTWVTSIVLAPGATTVNLPSMKTDRLRIDIANADNAPLLIQEVAGFQAPRWLVAYLKAGATYAILTGNAQAAAPEYDLKDFTDSLKTTPPLLIPGPLQPINFVAHQPAAPVAGRASRQYSSLLLWGILSAILILLVYFSVKMVRSISKK
jgi:hypothetical protein